MGNKTPVKSVGLRDSHESPKAPAQFSPDQKVADSTDAATENLRLTMELSEAREGYSALIERMMEQQVKPTGIRHAYASPDAII